jgi:hypothetical protein
MIHSVSGSRRAAARRAAPPGLPDHYLQRVRNLRNFAPLALHRGRPTVQRDGPGAKADVDAEYVAVQDPQFGGSQRGSGADPLT